MEAVTPGTINVDPLMFSMNGYREMKAKFRQKYDDTMYTTMTWNSLLSMFEYDDKLFRPELFERILRDTGVVALIKTSISDYTPVFCNMCGGDRYPDGFFKDAICYDLTGKQYNFKNWRENEKILVFFNNFTYTPDIFIDKYSYMLTEIDKSIISNVIYSRLKPIPVAKDGQAKNKIDAVISDLEKGVLKTIINDFDVSDIIDNNRPAIEVMNLTDVESSKFIQYLQHLHDSMISRLFFMMGLSISDSGKQAQLSIDELNKSKSAALSLLNGWHVMRKRGFEDAKEKTGEEWHFDFSEIWRTEIETNEIEPDDVEQNQNQEDTQEVEEPIANDKESEEDGTDNAE